MRLRALIALILACLALPALAATEEVVLGLSKDRVAITTRFDGSDILIFGAVKRDGPVPEGPPLEVIVTVAGPSEPVVVRRKENRFGIWVNTEAVEVESAPSFYAVATSGPFSDVLSVAEDARYKISVPRAIRSEWDYANFTEALIRIRENNAQYVLREAQVAVDEQTLFRTSLRLPSALVEGDYVTRIFLTRGGEVVTTYETVIDVDKVGLERWLYDLSRNQPLLYGLMSLAIAIAAGWSASAAFGLLRN